MYRIFRDLTLLAALFLSSLVCSTPFCNADDNQLAVIEAGYRQSLSRLTSVHAKCEQETEFIAQSKSLRERISLPSGTHLVEWAIDGGRRLYHIEPTESAENTLHDFRSSDGSFFWNVEWSGDQPARVFKRAQAETGSRWFRDHRGPGHFLGLFLDVGHSVRARSLRELFQDSRTHVAGQETLDGQACWKVDFGPFPTGPIPNESKTSDLWISAWFDPAAGYLPRQIAFWSTESGSRTELLKTRSTNRVTSFRRLDEISGWFPETMVLESWLARETFQLREVTVGKRLPKQLFQPTIDGVPIVNLSDPRSKDAYDRELIAASVSDNEAAVNTAGGRILSATPPAPGSSTRRWLLVAGGVFLALTIGVWFVRQRAERVM